MAPTTDTVRDRILETAYDKFKAHGVRRVTMDDVAYELRMSKKTLYKYYDGKSGIVKAIVEKHYIPKAEAVQAAIQEDGDVTHTLAAGFSAILKMVESAVPMFMADVKSDYPDIWEAFDRKRTENLELVIRTLKRGVGTGEIRHGVDPKVVAGMMQCILRHYIVPDNLLAEGITPKQALETWFTLLTGGVFKNPPEFSV